MTMKLFSAAIALTCLGTIVGLPKIAEANPTLSTQVAQRTANQIQIDSFSVNDVDQLTPGTELVFTLEGTPNARASLTIGTGGRNLPMQEVEPGVYEGRYVIRNGDQLTDDTVVRANLRRGNQVASTRLQQPLATETATNGNSDLDNRSARSLFIDRFNVEPVQQLEPGAVLNFTLTGTPNAKATFSIEGVTYNQPMQEVSSGTYEGQYVIRRQDAFPDSGTTVTASLQSGRQVVRARLNQDLFAGNGSTNNTSTTQLPLDILSPQDNSRVSGTVEVRGRSAPNATVAVKVQASNSVAGIIGFNRDILNRTIRTDAQGNFSFTFNPSVSIPGTRYQVSLNATKGNQSSEESLVLIQQ